MLINILELEIYFLYVLLYIDFFLDQELYIFICLVVGSCSVLFFTGVRKQLTQMALSSLILMFTDPAGLTGNE